MKTEKLNPKTLKEIILDKFPGEEGKAEALVVDIINYYMSLIKPALRANQILITDEIVRGVINYVKENYEPKATCNAEPETKV